MCRLVRLSRNTFHYESIDKSEDQMIIERMNAITARFKRFGYRRIQVILEREGIKINHKKVYHLYKEAGLALKRKRKNVVIKSAVNPNEQVPSQIHVGQWTLFLMLRELENG